MVVKLKDVADLAGVSVTTVSRVINNYGSLSERTIKKVHEAMRKLNYQPNALARAMQGKPSKFIGLIFPNITNPFFAELINSLEYKLFKQGYKTIIASSAQNEEIEHDYLGMLMANQVDGIISGSHNLGIREYQQLTSPIVSFDRYLADNIPIVAADSYHGGQLSAQFVVKKGARKIAVMIDEDTSVSPTLNRVQGAIDYLSKAHIPYTPLDLKHTNFDEVFPGEYDGVIATNDLQALMIRNVGVLHGKKINEDFVVTGYDGSQLILKAEPSLPTVVQPIDAIADELIATLMAKIKDPHANIKPQPLKVTFHDPEV
ncbi:MAG TPA: LacI family DNA-binding transcriptional regulator [Candidatus Limosilactobacillus merdigallinarum]|uniref:LacI family DNA-binding transcriptional regulator n=1 Tax=Candidatus Limosilactobacillus merdigallinarum TaxID=2838652 RepID=A0A9D1VHM4_9LACO|nr:LacI family DNA-binding transcriptional regulator [Candidatus Limosilactobacillus merdigallinarum]